MFGDFYWLPSNTSSKNSKLEYGGGCQSSQKQNKKAENVEIYY